MSKKTLGKPPSQRGNRPSIVRPDRGNPNDLRYIAHHEAGHAVSAVVLGFPLRTVDIKRRPMPGGQVSMGFTDTGPVGIKEVAGKGEAAARRLIVQCMTGPLAEMEVNPRLLEEGGDRQDRADAMRTATVAMCVPQDRGGGRMEISSAEQVRNKDRINALVMSSLQEAAELVATHWPAIHRVADLLIRRQSLTGDEVTEVVRTAPPSNA